MFVGVCKLLRMNMLIDNRRTLIVCVCVWCVLVERLGTALAVFNQPLFA